MYEIYSIGDGAYLTAVLNAVAMLTGGDDMRDLAAVGFLIGIILVMFQGILQARFPPLQNVLVAWVIYMAMFGPTARVQVEDLYTGATRHVDNVPLGVAFVGSAMSQVGYGVTRLFEQAFSTPAMTDYGFAAPLQLLQDTRKGTWSRTAQGKANEPTPGADMEASWSNYIADCVLWNVDTKRVTLDTILRDPAWHSAFAARDLVAVTTELWLGGAPVTRDCTTAWGLPQPYTTTAYTPAIRRSLAATLNIDEANVDGSIQAALDALAGMGTDAQEYMVMASLAPFWTTGKANVYRELGNYAEAAMVEQAAQQRNSQWAAEERLFSRIVRPMMTFFEAFLFAISPLMMFAIGLGPLGIRMVGKYLVFALWIQLWKPIMAVIHLYIVMAAGRKLDALQAVASGDVPIPSLMSLWKMDLILSDYLGTGGMLAASTPAISLMLIYGSAVTATHLAGRLQNSDHINEKMVSPDVMQPAAALTMGPLQAHTPLSGTVTPDAHQAMPSLYLAHSTENSVRSAATAQSQSMETFRSTLASVAARSAQESNSAGSGGTRSWNVSTSNSQTDKFATERAETVRKDLELGEGYRDVMASAYSAGLRVAAASGSSGGQGGSSGAIRAAIQGVLGNSPAGRMAGAVAGAVQPHAEGDIKGSHESASAAQDKMTDGISQAVRADMSNSVELASRLATDLRTSHENLFTHGVSQSDQSQLERAATDAVTSTKAFEQAQATRAQYGMSTSYRADHLSQALVSKPADWSATRQEFIQRFGYLNGDLDRVTDKYKHLLGPEKAEAFGMVSLLIGTHDKPTIHQMTQAEQQSASDFGYRLVSQAMGGTQVGGVNPNAYQGLTGTAQVFGQTRGAVRAGGLSDPRDEAASVPGQARAHYQTGRYLVSGTDDEVRQRYQTGRDNQVLTEARERAQFNEGRRETLGQQIQEQGVLPKSLPAWTVENVGGFIKDWGYELNGAANWTAEATGATGRFLGALNSGQGLEGAKSAAGDGWGQASEAIMNARLAATRGTGERQLTDAQMGVYRAAMDSYFPFLDGAQNALGTDLAAARQRLVAEEGPLGEAMANVLVSAAWSQQDAGLAPLRAYNQAEVSQDKLRAKIEDLEKKSAEPRGGRVGGGPIEAPAHLQGHLQDLEVRYGLPTGLLTAIAHTESRFNPNAVSHAGAQGMFQIMPATASRLGVADPFDPEQGAVGAAKHLAASYARFGNWEHAVMAYNAGDGRIEKFLVGEGKPLKQETIDYLPKVAGALQRVRVG